MGVAIAKGILKTLKITWKAPEDPRKYQVYVGEKCTREQAKALQQKLKDQGYDAVIVSG